MAALHTGATRAVLHVAKTEMSPERAAQKLGYVVFDEEAELSEKFALGSSVGWHKGPHGDILRLIIKSPTDVEGKKVEALKELLQSSWANFTGQPPAIGATPKGDGTAASAEGFPQEPAS